MIDTYVSFIFDIGLIGFFFYMVIVGTFIPAPTQILLIPAGVLVHSGQMELVPLLLTTATGTTIGASINYFLSKKYINKLIPKKKTEKLMKFFHHYGDLSVLLAPMMLGLGQYISLVAGISRMNYFKFAIYVWVSNLIFDLSMIMIGYFAGKESKYPLFLMIGGIIFIVCTFYFKVKRTLRED